MQQVGSAAVAKEKQTLAQAPERRRAELVRTGGALRNIIGKIGTHVMHSEVGEVLLLRAKQARSGADLPVAAPAHG